MGHRSASVRPESLTNQLHSLAKHKPRCDAQRILDPLPPTTPRTDAKSELLMDTASLQKHTQSPLRLQWLVDDFVKAAGSGDLKKVDQYIRGGVPVDRSHSVLRYSALHAAASLENDAVTKVLVHAGANVNAATQNCETALHMAARFGKPAVALEILRHSAVTKSPNHIAADRQDHQLERLLEHAPTDVRAQAIASTSLTVAWSASCSRSSAYAFKITWALCDSAGEFTEECALPYFRIGNLLPASTYSVAVQAGNHTAGWSERSSPVTFCTDGDAPNATVAPEIVEVGDSFIRMRIQLPQSNGSEITRVAIQSQCTGSIAAVSTSSFRRLLKPQDHERAWESLVCDVSHLRTCDAVDSRPGGAAGAAATSTTPGVVVQAGNGLRGGYKEFVPAGLTPGHVYYFRVCAWNQRGWSPEGEVSDGICTNDCPKVVARAARSMHLVWTKPYSTEHIDCYELQARVSTSTTWEVVATRISGQSLDVRGLVPATAYSFRVVPHYALRGWGDAQAASCSPLESTDAATPEAPVDVCVLDRTAHSITVSWQIPRCNGHVVDCYALQCRLCSASGGGGEWFDVNSAIPVDFGERFVVAQLQRGSAYQFRVRAHNALGDGAFASLDQVVWTYPFVAPTAPECTGRTSFSLRIAWRDGQSTDDADELVYDVHMSHAERLPAAGADAERESGPRESSSRHWVVVAHNLRTCDTLVSGLAPLSYYVFRIQAHRAADATGATMAAETKSLHASSVLGPVSAACETLRRL
ncbi:hypothetical protein PybrP1_002981 [[Pythium] brassicae (nom. inval.)]|nr:hypothetical protein PybrP1_002981 [[Pythium] brassicae (nom. inval.)]